MYLQVAALTFCHTCSQVNSKHFTANWRWARLCIVCSNHNKDCIICCIFLWPISFFSFYFLNNLRSYIHFSDPFLFRCFGDYKDKNDFIIQIKGRYLAINTENQRQIKNENRLSLKVMEISSSLNYVQDE